MPIRVSVSEHSHGSAYFHLGGNNPGWVMYILPFLALTVPPKIDLLRAEVMAFDSSCFEKDWHNIKRLFYPSWMLTYALIIRVVVLILICLLQHIRQQQAATEATLQELMALRHSSGSPPQVMHAWLSKIQKATT